MGSRIAAQLGSSHEPFLIEGTDVALRQQVGLLSRLPPLQRLWRSRARETFPLPGSKCGHGAESTQTTGVSKHLLARFAPVPGQEIVVIGLHLKAQPQKPAACAQREAQASVIRSL